MAENAVKLIIEPKIDWDGLLKNSYPALGRSITASLDQKKISLDRSSSFLLALTDLQGSTNDPLKEPSKDLRHLSFSFLVAASRSTIYDLLEATRLSVCSTKSLAKGILLVVVSGNLEEWHNAIINCSTKDASLSLRDLCNKFILQFDKQGFQNLWHRYMRSSHNDGTFLLIEKSK
jgi:hypothetical protein